MFISLEGIEGAGKTSQISALVHRLEDRKRRCVVTREPGGTVIGEKIRAIVLDPDHRALDPMAELLLYVADRIQHLRQVIEPALASGATVICDRYIDATLAYQGLARGLGREVIDQIHRIAVGARSPDLTLLLDLDPELGLRRAWSAVDRGGRSVAETRFETEQLAFHRRVREGYLSLAAEAPQRFRVIDASHSFQTVARAIGQVVADFLTGFEESRQR
jgi:dTMP kinase